MNKKKILSLIIKTSAPYAPHERFLFLISLGVYLEVGHMPTMIWFINHHAFYAFSYLYQNTNISLGFSILQLKIPPKNCIPKNTFRFLRCLNLAAERDWFSISSSSSNSPSVFFCLPYKYNKVLNILSYMYVLDMICYIFFIHYFALEKVNIIWTITLLNTLLYIIFFSITIVSILKFQTPLWYT